MPDYFHAHSLYAAHDGVLAPLHVALGNRLGEEQRDGLTGSVGESSFTSFPIRRKQPVSTRNPEDLWKPKSTMKPVTLLALYIGGNDSVLPTMLIVGGKY